MKLDEQTVQKIIDIAYKWAYHEDLDAEPARPHLAKELRKLELVFKPGDLSQSVLVDMAQLDWTNVYDKSK